MALLNLGLKFFLWVWALIMIYLILTVLSEAGTLILVTFGFRIYTVISSLYSSLPWLVLTVIFALKSFHQPYYYFDKMMGRQIELYRVAAWMTAGTGLIVSGLVFTANLLKPSGDWLALAANSAFTAYCSYTLVRHWAQNR